MKDTERNITLQGQASYYKKYTDHLCSVNTGIKTCTSDRMATNLHSFSKAV